MVPSLRLMAVTIACCILLSKSSNMLCAIGHGNTVALGRRTGRLMMNTFDLVSTLIRKHRTFTRLFTVYRLPPVDRRKRLACGGVVLAVLLLIPRRLRSFS